MGHGYHHRNIHQGTTTFLPTLCRISINDVKPTQQKISPGGGGAGTDDPSSPKVSCIGQVKRNNNKVLAFPTPPYSASAGAVRVAAVGGGGANNYAHSFKGSNLKRLFSGKSLTPSTATSAGGRRRGSGNCIRKSRKVKNEDENRGGGGGVVDITELDPPLPVVKRVLPPSAAGEASLWKRRSGGEALKTLQIKLDMNNLIIPPRTV